MDYKISVEKTSEVNRSLNIEVPREMYTERYTRRLQSAAGKAKIKGFRQGRVPKDLVKKLYGPEIHSDVVTELCRAGYEAAVREHSLRVVGHPEIDLPSFAEEGEEPLKFVAKVSVVPEPELKEYFGIDLDVKKRTVEQEDVERAIAELVDHLAKTEEVTGRDTVQDEDVIEIDVKSRVDGNKDTDSETNGVQVDLKREKLPDGFKEHVLGLKAGETKSFSLVLSDDGDEPGLSGKTVDYTVSLKKLLQKSMPEMTDELVKENKLGESAAGLREDVEKRLNREISRQNKQLREQRLFEVLTEKNGFDMPQPLIDDEIRGMLFEMKLLDPKDQRSYQVDVSRFHSLLGKQAELRARTNVLLQRIVEVEDVQVDNSDQDLFLDELLEEDPTSDRDKLKKMFGFPSPNQRVTETLRRNKVIRLLLEKANIAETREERA